MLELWTDTIASDIGPIVLVTDQNSLCALDFADCEARMQRSLEKRFGSFRLVERANPLGYSDRLRSYLAGHLDSLDDIITNPGGTPFQQTVWQALRSIPPGTVFTYQELATQIGNPTACRAVGMTNSQNPIAIVLPCHRVIGSNGTLTGYAGGIHRKQWLLRHEGFQVPSPETQSIQQLALF